MSYNKLDDQSISLFFGAIANPKRFRILVTLNERGPMCVSQLEELLGIEQSDLSHNLQCLLNCRFVNREQRGKEKVYSLNEDMKVLVDSINSHIEAYDRYIKSCEIVNDKNLVKGVDNGKLSNLA
ncbi:ArsR family transcriptional regulator [Candidatus Mancarchaeum acidiphilum]|uniref:ArsR family transcriptional regulator n=1 Tax=Candidatus Mancarchaeum acidiphilum TaxID=1920749 RepID=A0A218NMW1_9ARCH|nr:metalloregulator ArsR/SmtB family transcription factor [Candidatus Mancarchaeum acidiphilum]ASI13791.1 ArsR family transcriptional regulator [Candidatus Mancarchaeum acidiphilum]